MSNSRLSDVLTKDLSLQNICPSKKEEWSLFLNWSAEYFKESWAEEYSHQNLDAIVSDYDTFLCDSMKKERRRIFLLERESKPIGFTNIFIAKGNVLRRRCYVTSYM